MTVLAPHLPPVAARPDHRLPALSGAGFVACALVGNTLTESAGGVVAASASTAARLGLALELVGFVLLLVFVGWLGSAVLGRSGASMAGYAAVTAGGVLVAVKLGSGADLLAAWHQHGALDKTAVEALVAANGEAFVLSWLPMGVLVAAAAVALAGVGLVGRVMQVSGVVVGGLTVGFGILGSVLPAAGVPIPFLLCLVWLVAVGVLGLRRR
jgi:hypothetical protein